MRRVVKIGEKEETQDEEETQMKNLLLHAAPPIRDNQFRTSLDDI